MSFLDSKSGITTSLFNTACGPVNTDAAKEAQILIDKMPGLETYQNRLVSALEYLHSKQTDDWESVHKNKWAAMQRGDFAFVARTFETSSWGKRAPEEAAHFKALLGPLANVKSPSDLEEKPSIKRTFEEKSGAAVRKENVLEGLRPILVKREGYKETVYKDSEGELTVGIGHLVKSEDGLKLGGRVSKQQIEDFYKEDASDAVDAAIEQAKQLGVQDNLKFVTALSSVNFQLGTGWNGIHKKTWGLMKEGKFSEAAIEAADSKWAKQTPVRVEDFQKALRQLERDLQPSAEQGPAPVQTTQAPAA